MPVAMIKESYETDVVEAGARCSIVTILLSSSRAVAEPNTNSNFSGEYCLKASFNGRKILEMGMRSGFAMVRGAEIFQKKWVDGEISVTL